MALSIFLKYRGVKRNYESPKKNCLNQNYLDSEFDNRSSKRLPQRLPTYGHKSKASRMKAKQHMMKMMFLTTHEARLTSRNIILLLFNFGRIIGRYFFVLNKELDPEVYHN